MSLRARAVIVGAGLMGRWHADAVRRSGGEVLAVVDPAETRARTLSRREGCPDFRDLGSALAIDVPDVVHVCTPLDTHEHLCRTALDAGSHVLVEKPVAPTAAGTRALLDQAAERNRFLVPVYQFLYQDGVRRVLERLDAFGPLVHVRGTALSAGAEGLSVPERDRVAVEVLPHFLALTGRLLRCRVSELSFNVEHPRGGDILVTAVSDETSVSILVSMSGRPTRNTLEVLGREASAYMDLFHGFSTLERGRPSRRHKAVRPFLVAGGRLSRSGANLVSRILRREPAYPGLRELVRRTHSAALGSGPPPIDASEALDVSAAWERISGRV